MTSVGTPPGVTVCHPPKDKSPRWGKPAGTCAATTTSRSPVKRGLPKNCSAYPPINATDTCACLARRASSRAPKASVSGSKRGLFLYGGDKRPPYLSLLTVSRGLSDRRHVPERHQHARLHRRVRG